MDIIKAPPFYSGCPISKVAMCDLLFFTQLCLFTTSVSGMHEDLNILMTMHGIFLMFTGTNILSRALAVHWWLLNFT